MRAPLHRPCLGDMSWVLAIGLLLFQNACHRGSEDAKELVAFEQRLYVAAYKEILTEEGLQRLVSGDFATEGEDLHGWKPAAPEVLIAVGAEDSIDLPEIYRLDRLDVLLRQGEEISYSRVVKDPYREFEPFSFEWEETTQISISPFHWYHIEFGLRGVDFGVNGVGGPWAAYEAWAEKWLDVNDKKIASLDDWQLSETIHRVYPPRKVEDRVWLDIDFGSASTDAFWELLSVLSAMGATDIKIGSFSIINAGQPSP